MYIIKYYIIIIKYYIIIEYTIDMKNITKKNINFKPYIEHFKHNNIKNIYIKNNAGFGNKLYDLIFAIYLYNLYNLYNNKSVENIYKRPYKCSINYVLIKSKHENINDPTIDTIFIYAKSKINFINERQYQNVKKNPYIKINKLYNDNPKLQNLKSFPKYEELSLYNKIDNNFKLVYEMYKTFSQKDKDIFININKNILSDKNKLYKIISQPYSLVHIRYGDKLHYLNKIITKPDIDIKTLVSKNYNNNPIDQFILYTPEYYIDKINELLEKTPNHMNIYIISDSVNIVKQFIMNISSINDNSRIILLDKMTWWDSFYLLYYASNIILSNSTFCFAGAYFNKKNAKCDLLLYHHDETNPNIAPEEYAISPSWNILSDRKYILNYNPKIAYIVLQYKYFWTD